MRIAFFGTPEFSLPALTALLADGQDVVCVYTQPPRGAGRGEHERRSAVHELAAAHAIEVRTPTMLKDSEIQAAFVALDLDAAVVVAYGLILPAPILDAPRHGCINIHASLLPRWRGAAPIQRALLAGDDETGVTIMAMDEGLDTGPKLMREAMPIGPATTASDLHDGLAAMGARLIVATLGGLDNGRVTPVAQPGDGTTYAKKLAREEGRINWSCTAVAIERQVRALTPWPGCWFNHDGQRFNVLAATIVDGKGVPGMVLDDALCIACADGAVRLDRVQRQGRAPMSADELLRGFPIAAGTVLDATGGDTAAA